MIEYRVCWSASSNITFHGATEWEAWEDEDATANQIAEEMEAGSGGAPRLLAEVLEEAGLEYWLETRETESQEAG